MFSIICKEMGASERDNYKSAIIAEDNAIYHFQETNALTEN